MTILPIYTMSMDTSGLQTKSPTKTGRICGFKKALQPILRRWSTMNWAVRKPMMKSSVDTKEIPETKNRWWVVRSYQKKKRMLAGIFMQKVHFSCTA